jgi:hypothetical protein
MVGLSERDRTLLRSLLAASQARTGIRWDGAANQPVVHFIDIDGQPGAEFWQSLATEERRDAAIVISAAEPADGTRWLPRPLRSASLLGVLEQMKLPVRGPASTPARQTPAASPVFAASTTVLTRNPNDPLRLLDVFDDPATTTARVVQSPHWPDLVLGSGNAHAMRTAPLESYIEGFAASTDVGRVAKYTGGPLDDELRIDADKLRWLAMLHAPLGELARRLPGAERVRLRTLPAFGHLPHTLQHVRMAAWLTQHAASRRELAEMTGLDNESVQRFLGACDAIGLLQEVEAAPAPAPIVAPAVAPIIVSAPPPTRTATPAAVTPVVVEDVVHIAAAQLPAPVRLEEPIVAAEADVPLESMSVLERLRATREQNRARVAAAIRDVQSR